VENRDAYVNRITKAALALIKDDGIRDPSVSEIACRMLKEPLPSDPLAQPPQLGGEIYNGVSKRLKKVRQQLEDVHGVQCALISGQYYLLKFREHGIDDFDDARLCMPSGSGNKSVGLYAVVPGAKGGNLIYQAWLEFNGKSGGARTNRALVQTLKAHEAGALTFDEGNHIVTAIGHHLTVTPAEVAAKIAPNGPGHLPAK
jgi:hypothetical protein